MNPTLAAMINELATLTGYMHDHAQRLTKEDQAALARELPDLAARCTEISHRITKLRKEAAK